MNTVEKIYNQLKDLPELVLIMSKLQKDLQNEHEKRLAYYALIHEDVNAEFIAGEIVFNSPVKLEHWDTTNKLAARLTVFVEENNLGKVGTEKVCISLSRNNYEPDICFFNNEKTSLMNKGQMLFPAPDFVVEVLSESTKERDYGVKYRDYAAHGVLEYWIINTDTRTIEQYILNENKEYELNVKISEQGVLKSKAVTGFEVEISKIF